MEITFPDGTRVRASGIANRGANDDWRGFGLYCDAAWKPDWEAVTIDWPDFGLPVAPETAASQIVDAFQRAQSGTHVEVGCLGGIGRTGTVLACMAILAGVPGESAVGWVREHYRPEAVETAAQANWVGWFAAWLERTTAT
ncbi:MAG TPA: protein-tyrosine phosphatase family protein [Thermomicrobiales bacterium]|nr:protein-tyrosine phosphatase family protein [Thermomicrobiales bacterium]